MEQEILNIFYNSSKQCCSVNCLFRLLKNKSGGRPAMIKAANRLAKKGKIKKVQFYNGAVLYGRLLN